MTIAPGTRIGTYEVVGVVGVGGMGEVYRAKDTLLDREVAIKVLPEAFATDAERAARFEREAKTLASLDHVNIAHIYGLEKSGGTDALVMEFVDGPTLAERLAGGPLSIDNALDVALQIAAALETAHEHGVVHRDLKPANIKLRPDGTVKILDFGIAKTLNPGSATGSASGDSTPAMTRVGAVLGTTAYMSPEQARGKNVDARTDIWAFGCVLYEMLTGQPPFGGEDATVTIARVLERDVDLDALPRSLAPAIRQTIGLCLRKDVARRVRNIGDVRLALEGAFMPPATARASGSVLRPALLVAAGLLIGSAVATAWFARSPRSQPPQPQPQPEMRFEIATAEFTDSTSLALSPDSQYIAYEANVDGQSRLWLHSLESLVDRPLVGTESASFPFWSPDGSSIGFFADGKLKRIDLDSGSVRILANAPIGRGGAWGDGDTIVFAPGTNDPLLAVSALGGEPTVVTHLDTNQVGHRFPQFLPDGRRFLYYATGAPDARGVILADRSGSTLERLLDADTAAVLTASSHLLFARQGTLYSQRFDPTGEAVTGTAVPVPESIAIDGAVYRVAFTASAAGPVAYRIATPGGGRQFTWLDRSGTVIETVGEPIDDALSPAISPDGRSVAYSRTVNGNQDIWLLDLRTEIHTRFTFDTGLDFVPLWSPDGTRIVFSSSRSGVFDLYEKPASGAGSEELLFASAENKFAVDWSPSDNALVFVSNSPRTSYDLWRLSLDGGPGAPTPLVRTPFEERDAQVSPNGQWIAYQSNESGRLEVYVQSYPEPGGRWQISTDGGAQVRWRGDGAELYYLALDGKLMAAPVRVVVGPAIEAGAPQALFTPRLGRGVQTSNRQQYIVSPDGQSFLMNAFVSDTAQPIQIALNWRETR